MGDPSLRAELAEAGEDDAWDWERAKLQRDFITAEEPFTVISGGFGLGKTTGLCAKTILLMTAIPNNLGYLGRLDGKALRASTIQSLDDMLPKSWIKRHNEAKGFIQLKAEVGGSKLIYGDFKDLNDLKNMPLGFFAIDQMEEIPQSVFDYLVGRIRRRTPILVDGLRQYFVEGECPFATVGTRHYALHGDERCRLCSASLPPFSVKTLPGKELPPWDMVIYKRYGFGAANPEGPSHWIYKYFPGLPSANGISVGNGDPDYKAFHGTLYDGLEAGFVDRAYVSKLEHLYGNNEAMKQRYILGMWVEAEGMVYPDWRRDLHTFRFGQKRHDGEEFLHDGMAPYEYLDHGLTTTTAVGFLYVEDCQCGCKKQNIYLVDEHYQANSVVSRHAAAIKAHRTNLGWAGGPRATYIDSQAMSKTLMGQKGTPREDELYSVADEYYDNDIAVLPNQKDWDAGYNRISEMLIIDEDHVNPFTGKKGAPHFFAATRCVGFIEEIETYKWKKVKNAANTHTEEPADGHDDHMDGLNGFVTTRPDAAPPTEEVARRDIEEELDKWDEHFGSEYSHMGI